MMPPFQIFKVGEDGLRDLVEVSTLDVAKARVQELAELWPGEYVISEEGAPESGEAKK